MCLHTSISFSDASSGTIESALAEIDTIIAQSDSTQASQKDPQVAIDSILELNAAPENPPNMHQQILYTPWELMHRTAMIQGFSWTWWVANYITPAMYIGTPIQTNMNTLGYDATLGATNYSECVRMEIDTSFGIGGELIEKNTESELRSIAKYCAIEYRGTYFEGKKYTTREEMLMMLFVMFDEGVYLPGYFNKKQFIFDGEETETNYNNVWTRTWFAPYISLASDLGMVEDIWNWSTAKMVTDSDIQLMLNMYLMDEDGEITDGIETEYGIYYIAYNEGKLTIEKVHKTATSTNNNTATTSQNTINESHGKIQKFEIVAPATAKVNEAIDITVRAIDKDKKTVTNYSWSIIFISDRFGDVVPSPGKSISFTLQDTGIKIFHKWVTFRSPGKQKIYVADVENSADVMGEVEINITQ
jgi:hypothetical protein